MGDATSLHTIAENIKGSLSPAGAAVVEVVGLDMEDPTESAFHGAVDKACRILGKLDAFVNCFTYEGH